MELPTNTNVEQDKELYDNPYFEQLAQLGFSKAEANIYVFLLKRGESTGVSKIASGTRMHRQQVYITIPILLRYGVIEEINEKSVSKYKAHPPHVLERMTRKQMILAEDVAKDLQKVSKIGHEQDFEVFVGQQAIIDFELEYSRNVVFGSEEYILGGKTTLFSELMGENLDGYLKNKEEKEVKVYYIGSQGDSSLEETYKKSQRFLFRYFKKLPEGVTHTGIRKDAVLFYSFLNPPLLYVIKSDVVAQNYKDFFMMLWEMLE